MPIQEFWADSREYFEFQRCGGSMTHLNRILGGMSALVAWFCWSGVRVMVNRCKSSSVQINYKFHVDP